MDVNTRLSLLSSAFFSFFFFSFSLIYRYPPHVASERSHAGKKDVRATTCLAGATSALILRFLPFEIISSLSLLGASWTFHQIIAERAADFLTRE